jgi:peptidyl-dipeptidase Dcp
VNLRHRLANLLGYANYASYILDDRMAGTIENVYRFMDQLSNYYLPEAKVEFDRICEYAKDLGADFEIQRWDWTFYAEKLKEAEYSITDEVFRPYFQLEKVQRGIFDLAARLYGITFRQTNDVPLYHKNMEVYEVFDEQGEFLAILYLDYFPRKSKKGGAWMTEFVQQHFVKETDIRPHVSLVFNFTPPTSKKPSLLTYAEVRTFLHEFGHALHCIFSKVIYSSLAGTEVYRDFVELPSQIMENWAECIEWFDSFAIHYLTGEKIPELLLDKLIESRNFNMAFTGCRQLSYSYLDLAWHTITELWENDPEQMEKHAMSKLELLPSITGISVSTSFNHIFAGGYAAGYYGYKWAEVLDADAFSVFKENGMFDRSTATRFRNCILSKGGTEHPMKLYINFRGKEPSIEALLKRNGLI